MQAAQPIHLQGQARAFLKATGYEPAAWTSSHTVRAHLHDFCWHCDACDDWFASKSEMAEDEDQPEYGRWCWYCKWGYRKPGEAVAA